MRSFLILCLATLAPPVGAQDIEFDIAPVEACLMDAPDKQDCIGLASNACMNTPERQDGSVPEASTTLGMEYCLGKELEWWDAQLNETYGEALAGARGADVSAKQTGSSMPSRAEPFQAMQRVWIKFRDATCVYEASKWGSGSGRGPALQSCLLRMTAEQALYLEWASEGR